MRFAMLWVYWFSLYLCVVLDVGLWAVGLFWKCFRGVWGIIRPGRAQKPHTPRAGAQKNIRGELDRGMVLDDIREKKCLSNGWIGTWEEGHVRVGRGMLETEHRLQKKEKEREIVVGPG